MSKINLSKVNELITKNLIHILSDYSDEILDNPKKFDGNEEALTELKYASLDKFVYFMKNRINIPQDINITVPVDIFYVLMSEEDIKEFEQEHPLSPFPAISYAEIYTNGLDIYDHPEICITLNIGEEIAGSLFKGLVSEIAENENFELKTGVNNDIIENFPVKIIEGEVTHRLYIILPDKNGKFPGDEGCEEAFSYQLSVMEFIESEYEKENIDE